MTPKATNTTDYERLVAQETLILDATEAIVELLQEQGVSRQELAARLGKSKGFVSQLLSGERNMTLRTLADLAYVLGQRCSLAIRALEEGDQRLHSTTVEFGELEQATPVDQENRAETPVDAVEQWSGGRGDADAHEYALAA
jgi:transcriptional regulator with XRE-family HTH domain